MGTNKDRKSRVPLFASVMQPNFAWNEFESDVLIGSTKIPDEVKGGKGEVSTPDLRLNVPDAAAVRAHEMLHVRFTPNIQPAAARLAREGIANAPLQIAEDIRLSYIAHNNGLWPDGAFFSSNTLDRVTQKLALLGNPGRLTEQRIHETRVGAAYLLLSMHGQPVEGARTLDAKGLVEDIKTHARSGGAPVAISSSIDRLLESSPQIEVALERVFDRAQQLFSGHPVGTEREQQALFSEMVKFVNSALESLLVEEEIPPPPLPIPSDEESDRADKTDQNSEPKSAPKTEEQKPEEPKAEPKPEEPKAEPEPKPEFEEGATTNTFDEEDDKEDGENEPEEGGEGEGESERLILSAAITQATAMASSLGREATDYMRTLSLTKSVKVGDFDLPFSPLMFGGFSAANNAADALVAIENINTSMDVDEKVGWAALKIERPPLERAFKTRVPRRGRPSLDGELPRHWSRWFSDRAILDSRGRRPGGTLLIDVSGSMSWTHAQTLALIEAVPAATVAVYSSDNAVYSSDNAVYSSDNAVYSSDNAVYSSDNMGYAGLLTILAHQGRVVSETNKWRKHHGGMNICDGPALAWLLRQPAPRVWFSDGGVTIPHGAGEESSLASRVDAQRLLRLGGGWITTDLDSVVDIFQGRMPKHASRVMKTWTHGRDRISRLGIVDWGKY